MAGFLRIISLTLAAAAALVLGPAAAPGAGEADCTPFPGARCTVEVRANIAFAGSIELSEDGAMGKDWACAPLCVRGEFAYGHREVWTAHPADGYTFTGWSGDCSGTGPCVVVVLTHDISFVANFASTAPPPTATTTPPSTGAPTPKCKAPRVVGLVLTGAKRAIVQASCRVGRVTFAASTAVKKGRVLAQRPRAGTVRPKGSAIALVVSAGPSK